MSWYSDGERFDEYDPPQCTYCSGIFTADECRKCMEEMKEIESEMEYEDD